MDTEQTPVCKLCGKCCNYEVDGVGHVCPNLVTAGQRKLCSIYNSPNRVNSIIDTHGKIKIRCAMREDVHKNYDGCPYNEGTYDNRIDFIH